MGRTSIEWATHVWNPFTGCDRVSAGCAECYAVPTAAANQRKELGRARKAEAEGKPLPMLRYQNDGDPKTSGPGFAFTVHWDKLERPEKFPAGARVFVNSMSDVFHEEAPLEAIAKLFDVFRLQPWADFLVLTKRAERMVEVMADVYDPLLVEVLEHDEEFLPNVWLGVTIENRSFVHRADLLRQTPAAVRFVSAEPLLGPVAPDLNLTGIDWLIAGGESGNHFAEKPYRFLIDPDGRPRADRLRWVRDLRDDAVYNETAFFFKQWGGRTPKAAGRELDGRTWDEFPTAAQATRLQGAAHA